MTFKDKVRKALKYWDFSFKFEFVDYIKKKIIEKLK